jgi:hypothetical protein
MSFDKLEVKDYKQNQHMSFETKKVYFLPGYGEICRNCSRQDRDKRTQQLPEACADYKSNPETYTDIYKVTPKGEETVVSFIDH